MVPEFIVSLGEFTLDDPNPYRLTLIIVSVVLVGSLLLAFTVKAPPEDIEVEFTGLKPGEKLYEEVQHLRDTLRATDHPQVMRFVAEEKPAASIESICAELNTAMLSNDIDHIKQTIQKYIPEYISHTE